MKKLTAILIASLCFVLSLNAQKLSSIETYPSEGLGIFYVVKGDVLWRATPEGLVCWNTKTSKKIKEIPFSNLTKESIPVKLIDFQDNILFFYKEFNKEDKKYQLFYNQIAADGNSSTIENKLVGYIHQYLDKFTDWEKRYIGYPLPGTAISVEYFFKNIDIAPSSDGSFLYISNAGLNLYVFNKEMKMEYKISLDKAAIKSEDFASMGFGDYTTGISNGDNFVTILGKEVYASLGTHVDRNGKSYVLRKVYLDGKNEEIAKPNKDVPNYYVELITTEKGQNETKQKIKLDNNFITNIKFFEGKDGKMWLVGLYNDFPSTNSTLGIVTIDVENATAKFSPHSADYVTKFLGVKVAPKKNNIPLSRFQIYENGASSILVLGEKFENDFSNGYLFYGDLVPMMIDDQNNVKWLPILQKSSTFAGLDLGCGNYAYASLNNKHYFFYLDNEKSSASDLNQTLECRNCGNGYLRALVIDTKGEVVKKSIYDVASINRDLSGSFYTQNIQKVSEDEIIFEMLKTKKEGALVKVKVE